MSEEHNQKVGDVVVLMDENELGTIIQACIQFNTVGAPKLTIHQRTLVDNEAHGAVVLLSKRLDLLTKRVEGLLQDKKDLQMLVKIVELGSDDLADSLRELAEIVLGDSTLPPHLLDKAREAKELVDA